MTRHPWWYLPLVVIPGGLLALGAWRAWKHRHREEQT